MRQWIPDRQNYLQEILDMERLPADACHCGNKENLIQCLDCFSTNILCRSCCLDVHMSLPFHRINRWNGRFFIRSSLHAQGYIMHLGHEGKPCPSKQNVSQEIRKDEFVEGMGITSENIQEEKDTDQEDGWSNLEDVPTERIVIVVHTTGVFQHHVRWCTCSGYAKEDIQLLRLHLFPASNLRPRTAFTFDVLDHFYVDAMECKTSGDSFFQKLRRLTNNAFPDVVPVGSFKYLTVL
jgi:hypothetical protein